MDEGFDDIGMDRELTPGTLRTLLRHRYPDREPGDPDGFVALTQELVGHGYTHIREVSAMLDRNVASLRAQERTNPPRGQAGARFNAIGAVRVSAAAAHPDDPSPTAAPGKPVDERMARGSEREAAGDLVDAEAAYREADAGGIDASLAISRVCTARGDVTAMQRAYAAAIERGHVVAIFNSGILLKERGDVTAAELAYRAAAATGDVNALCNLGILLEEKRDFTGAEVAYRQADEAGDDDAACCLGQMLEDRGDLAGARAAFERSDERGHSMAPTRIGLLLEQAGDVAQARQAHARAAERGSVFGMLNLARVCRELGDLSGAEAAYRQADETGDGEASALLGLFLLTHDNRAGARAALARGVERGHPRALELLTKYAEDLRPNRH